MSVRYSEFNSLTPIWKHFLRDQNGETAQCKVKECKKILKITGGSTKGLQAHLQNVHKTNLKSASNPSEIVLPETPEYQPESKKAKLTNYFQPKLSQENKLSEIFARMTAKDGISFNTICTSLDIRAGLTARGFLNIPKSPNTIRKMVGDYANKIRALVVADIKSKLEKGDKFSFSFDEWTSLQCIRYMNINLHDSENSFWNLGMIKIVGSMPAEKCVDLLKCKLSKFELKFPECCLFND